jgi:DNA-binding SARP family transcriptional activator
VGGDGIQFRILGPLEVLVDGAQLRVGGPRQRALLALLLLSANEVVSRDRLIEELSGNGQTGSADHALRVQVSRLRKALGPSGEQRLLASPPGYLLRVEPGELDLHVFEQLYAEGRQALEEGDAEKTAAKLRAAEKLWRGRPLADLEFEPFARIEVERLEELRLAALEGRIEAELALGRDPELVPELESLVAEHPLRERLRSQLMLALYRCGRQADAL